MGKSDGYGQLYAIENGQLVPVNVRRPGRKPKYPLHKLNYNESFFVPGWKKHSSYMYRQARKKNIRIKQRVVHDEHPHTGETVKGVRIWRLPPKDKEQTSE